VAVTKYLSERMVTGCRFSDISQAFCATIDEATKHANGHPQVRFDISLGVADILCVHHKQGGAKQHQNQTTK